MTAHQAIIRAIPVADINVTSNVRLGGKGYSKASIAELAESIKHHGLLQPVIVRQVSEQVNGFEYIVVAGRRRVMACKAADLASVPCLVIDTDEARAYEMEIAENIQREQMTLADTARAVRTLMMIYNKGATVAKILGKSAPWVSKHLSVTANHVHPVVADWLETGKVEDLETLLKLDKLLKDPSEKHQERLAKELPRLHQLAEAGLLTRTEMNRTEAAISAAGRSEAVTTRKPGQTVTTETPAQQDLMTAQVTYNPAMEDVLKVPHDIAEHYRAAVEKAGHQTVWNQIQAALSLLTKDAE
ncbi:ParB/RepB/Spo0J family partition protein [Ideonella sp.]|uniref:ParB/RepB/Spo0J family partition protein n=1 Tax=Ideonella sp. TaxID=1929293 RepID=UPI00351BDA9B